MELKTYLQFNKEERIALSAALKYVHLVVDDTKVHNWVVSGGKTEFGAEHLLRLQVVLVKLETYLYSEVHLEADPDWVDRARKARAEDRVPFVADPEKMVQMLCECRQEQLVKVQNALTVVTQALVMIPDWDIDGDNQGVSCLGE